MIASLQVAPTTAQGPVEKRIEHKSARVTNARKRDPIEAIVRPRVFR